MSNIAMQGGAGGTGTVTLLAPSTSTDRVLTLPDATGTVLSDAGVGTVTQTMLAAAVVPLGVGQTWTNVTGSRAIGTTYTNSTGRPIMIIASSSASSLNGEYGITVSGSVIYGGNSAPNGGGVTASAIVPTGATYSVNVTGGTVSALGSWYELR